MKHFCTLLLFLLSLSLTAQQIQRIDQTTYEANSPSVWAKNFSTSYGIKPSVLDGLADLYRKDGLDSLARQKKVEKLIRDFQVVAPKEQKKLELNAADRQKLGITDRPDVAEGLEFHLYTQGANSPVVYALGNVKIWYGIPKKAFLGIVAVLEEKQSQIEDFDKKLREQVEKFEELRAELAARADNDAVAKRAKQLLEEGNIAEAERILEEDFDRDAKKLAYKAFELAEVKVLALKYNEATPYYQKAALLDENNSKYLLIYGVHLYEIAQYDEAIAFYQKNLAIDTVAFKDQPEKEAALYNNLGLAWQAKGNYDRAINYQEKALAIYLPLLGGKHPDIASCYDDLGWVWEDKGDYERALGYYEKARLIDSVIFGEKHSRMATRYNNLGLAWHYKGDYDRAIDYYEKALAIDSVVLGEKHPSMAIYYNNFGLAWKYKGEYDRAIDYYEKALAIDSVVFGNKHPRVATDFNNLGSIWQDKGENDRAIEYYERALAIDYAVFGNEHPNIAVRYNNIGMAWQDKGDYDRAIAYYEKTLSISVQYLGWEHPKTKTTAQNLSHAANDQGIELLDEKKHTEAILYFQKALDNAEQAEEWELSLTCLYNMGISQKERRHYVEAIATLEKGLARAEQTTELKYIPLLRWMRYEKFCCLVKMGRKKEAKELYQQLMEEAQTTHDFRLLEALEDKK